MIDNRPTKRKPWMKWYTSDWRAEPTLRMVSRSARSVWVDLLGLMHESTLIGSLLLNGRIPTLQDLAKVLGDDPQRLAEWMDELREAGVYSVDADGTIYSRKMRYDAEISEKGRKDVQKRGGSWAPGKKQKTPKREPKGDPNRGAIGDPTPQRLDNTTEVEEPESPLTGSNHDTQNLVDSLLVRAEPEPTIKPAQKPISSKVQRGTRWPAGQPVPPEWQAKAADNWSGRGLPVEAIPIEAEKFVAHWTAKAGKDATKVDWSAAWRTWYLNAYGVKSNGKTTSGQFGRNRDVIDDHPRGNFAAIADRLRAEREGRDAFDA